MLKFVGDELFQHQHIEKCFYSMNRFSVGASAFSIISDIHLHAIDGMNQYFYLCGLSAAEI